MRLIHTSSGCSILIAKTHTGESGSLRGTKNDSPHLRQHEQAQVGDADHLKVFANADAAETWLEENDPEGVAFEYEVLE
jgi:hypothetical protein